MDTVPTIQQLLTRWVGSRSLNQARAQLGVAWCTLNSWLKGKSKPRPRDLPHLAQVMGVDVAELQAAVAGDHAAQSIARADA